MSVPLGFASRQRHVQCGERQLRPQVIGGEREVEERRRRDDLHGLLVHH
jgi:hypothetical protein